MRIYLAGPITGLTYEAASDWRDEWAPKLEAIGCTTASPLRGKEHLKGKGVLAGVFDEGKAAVERDLWDIKRADVVLVNFLGASRVSIGTCCEIGYANAIGKHVVTVMPTPEAEAVLGYNPPRREDNQHDHIFITEMSSIIVPDMTAAFEWLKNMLTLNPLERAWWEPAVNFGSIRPT